MVGTLSKGNKKQTDVRASINDELDSLERLTRYTKDVVELLYIKITTLDPKDPDAPQRALTRWAPACEAFRGVIKDRIRYKLSAKDAPISSMKVESDSGLDKAESAAVVAALKAIALIPSENEKANASDQMTEEPEDGDDG
jgi:hypothetical protein